MSARPEKALPARAPRTTANERFKRTANRRFWLALLAAAAAHVLILRFGPTMTTELTYEPAVPPGEMRAVTLAVEVAVPPAPAPIAAPALPIVSELAVAEDVTIAATTFDNVPPPIEIPPPPPPRDGADAEFADYEHFAPYMVKPELMNRREVTRALERRYPAALRGGNVEGAVVVVFWIDEKGAVQRYEIRKSSGSAALDAAVEEVIEIMEFRPAVDRGEPIKVIVALPIRFQLR